MTKKTTPEKIILAALGSFVKIYNITDEQSDELWSFLKFKDKPLFLKGRRIDKDFHPFNRKTKMIGIGFLSYVIAYMKDAGWEFDLKDFREPEPIAEISDWNSLLKGVEFRYYQIDAIKRCLDNKNGIVMAPTGAGKTVIFAGLVKALDMPTLVLFNDVQLVHQTYNEFVNFGFNKKDLGIVQGTNDHPAKITFATIQSRHKIFDYIELFKAIIVDECHTSQSQSFKQLFVQTKAVWRFGFSGTPWDENVPAHAARVIQFLGPPIYTEKSTRDLIDEGYLADDRFVFVKCDRAKNGEIVFTKSGKDYFELYKQEIVNNSYRNLLIALICSIHRDEKIVILYENISREHGEKIRDAILDYMPNRNVKILHGGNSVKERSEAIKFFEANDSGIIVASRIFNQGINIKSVNVGICAAAGKSFIMAIQRPGRMLRKTDGKDNMIYYDFVDENSKVFLRQSKQRMKIYRDKGHKVEIISPGDLKRTS